VTVTREAEGSTLWRIDGDTPPQVVTRFAMRVDSVQLDATGALVLAAARPEPVRYRFAGEQLEEQALPFVASFIAVRGEGRFLRASTDQGIVLVEQGADRWIEVLRAERSVHGPVRFEDGWLVLADGRLHRRAGDAGAFTADVEVDWTCLQSAGSHAVACQNFGLVTVLPDLTTQPAFELMAFDGVQCATEAAQDRCDGQWLHFAAEAGLLRPSAPETAPMPAPTASNDDCNHAPGAPPGPVPWLALALIGWIATLRAKA
jgi:hypothetical protein